MISYKKLWVKLAELEMKKKDLCRVAGISSTVVTKMGRGESVTTDMLARICIALDCNIGDIVDIVKDKDVSAKGTQITKEIEEAKEI